MSAESGLRNPGDEDLLPPELADIGQAVGAALAVEAARATSSSDAGATGIAARHVAARRRRTSLIASAAALVLVLSGFALATHDSDESLQVVTEPSPPRDSSIASTTPSSTVPSADPNATTTTTDWLAASEPPPELPVDEPFRIATDAIAAPLGWTYTDSGDLGSAEAPFLLVVYGIPDGRSVTFTKEPAAGPMPAGPISEEQLADMTSVDGDLSFIRGVDIEGVSGRTYITGPSGTRYSAALAPLSQDGRTAYPPFGEPWPTYTFGLDDLEQILVDDLVRPNR